MEQLPGCADSQLNTIIREDIRTMAAALEPFIPQAAGKRFLVTGSYGMLASYLVYALLELSGRAEAHGLERAHVTALGRSKERMAGRFGCLLEREDLEAVYTDVLAFARERRRKDADKGIDGQAYDYIIHAASPTDPRSYLTAPEAVIRTNVTATDELLQLAAGDKTAGFLYISSGEVYGRLQKDVIREEDGGTYDAADPRNVYALSKRLGERLCREAAEKNGVPAMIVRPSHTYGPTLDPERDSRVFASFINDVINRRDIVMTSDGLATRAFTYLTDAVCGFLTVLFKGTPGEAYNVTNNAGIRSIREIASILAGAAPFRVSTVFGRPEAAYRENSNRTASIRSTEKLEKLGWSASVSPEEGFERTLRSFLA